MGMTKASGDRYLSKCLHGTKKPGNGKVEGGGHSKCQGPGASKLGGSRNRKVSMSG